MIVYFVVQKDVYKRQLTLQYNNKIINRGSQKAMRCNHSQGNELYLLQIKVGLHNKKGFY